MKVQLYFMDGLNFPLWFPNTLNLANAIRRHNRSCRLGVNGCSLRDTLVSFEVLYEKF